MIKTVHGFDGKCAPGKEDWAGQETFSLGVFPLIPKSSGKGYKRGAVKVRVKGPVAKKEEVYDKATEIMDQLDRGTYSGPKVVTIR